MFQPPLPVAYTRLSPEDTAARIGTARAALGDRLVVLGHHYQRDEIIRWADYRGDSLKLSQLAAQNTTVEYIVFCGVHFMAETADVLAEERQVVILPNLAAGCSMADMASLGQVEDAWERIGAVLGQEMPVPITYVNSTAALKAFVGRHGGACCTSSNARQVVEWALSRGRRLLFFPDQHLGRNTGVQLGFDPVTDMCVWDPLATGAGASDEELRRSRFILWKGHCSVHQRFTVEEIARARQEHPGVTVIVHPECPLEVVEAADQAGSTEYIIRQVNGAPAGTTWAIGTEINLVNRLQQEHPDKRVFCLDPVVCPCSTMYRIHPHYLCWVLENLAEGRVVNEIRVKPEVRQNARAALERMLQIS